MIGSVFIFDSVSLLYYYLQLKEPKKKRQEIQKIVTIIAFNML